MGKQQGRLLLSPKYGIKLVSLFLPFCWSVVDEAHRHCGYDPLTAGRFLAKIFD